MALSFPHQNLGYHLKMKMDTLSERLKKAMKYRGMSQAGLAASAGLSQPSVWKITSGKSHTTKKLLDIARALEVSPDWLAHGEGEMIEEINRNSLSADHNLSTEEKKFYDGIKIVPVWDENGLTDTATPVPEFIDTTNARAYKLKYDSGYSDLPAGCLVVVDTAEQPGSNDYVLASIKGKISAYRYSIGGSGVLLDADPRVDPIPVSEDVRVIGLIVFMSRSLRR
ncbi:helix-turn-helix domain-containing protein [Pantoea brenneri]|uniref:helix-turn-helix domain-containing protein n=1 Tax=Pantoea brenneri TaxID=472694 RepID=UPI00244BDDAA|nr:helix-turn-helix domain-containing protein [Pantoea brenneri]MDH1088708.1 helix-turn-helix domain-containing protein [Pantoea brenneri]